MELFRIEIKETLSKIIEIEAESIETALQTVQDLYKAEDLVLDAEDFAGVEFEVQQDNYFNNGYPQEISTV